MRYDAVLKMENTKLKFVVGFDSYGALEAFAELYDNNDVKIYAWYDEFMFESFRVENRDVMLISLKKNIKNIYNVVRRYEQNIKWGHLEEFVKKINKNLIVGTKALRESALLARNSDGDYIIV